MSKQTARQRRRAAVDAIIERIASDPTYRQQLLDNPAALSGVGAADEPEVVGYKPACGPLKTSCPPKATCANKSSCKKTLISVTPGN